MLIRRLIILLLIVGCVFGEKGEPQLKDGNCILYWLENDTKKEINIEFLNGNTVYDSLMKITYGYKLPIPGLITGYINFTDSQKMQYQLLDIQQVSINDKFYSGKKLKMYQNLLTSIPYILLGGLIYSIY